MKRSAVITTSHFRGSCNLVENSDRKSYFAFAVFSVLALAGCKTAEQRLDATQPKAIQVAEARARIEMKCPEATGTLLSREHVMPPGGLVIRGMDSNEYKVGVTGCGNHETMIVVCPSDSGCFAAQSR